MADEPNLNLPAASEVATQEDLNRWYVVAEEMAKLKEEEMTLRKKIFATYFPNPKEGTNDVPLSDGWLLKAQHKIDRKVDEAAMVALAEEFKAAKIPVKELIKFKPELKIAEYRKLGEEQRKVFEKALIVKPGAPSLEIVKPKRV